MNEKIGTDKTLCVLHKSKRTFFCDECALELCTQCRDKHPSNHTIRFIEETAKYITNYFYDGKENVKELRKKLNTAAKRDPTEMKMSDDKISPLNYGYKLIDDIYD